MDLYTPRQLLMAIVQKGYRRDQIFKRLFFRESYTFTTQKVDLDHVPSKTKIAAYCSPMIGAAVDRSQGFKTSSFMPAYVKSKHAVNPNMTVKRQPGESLGQPKTPAERQSALVMQNIKMEEEAITDREELMCAEMVLTGKTIIDGPNVETAHEIDTMRNPDNNITLSGAAKWDAADKADHDPSTDFELWAEESDGIIDIALMDKKAWSLFKQFKKVDDKLDTRRGSNSELETAVKDLGKTVSYKGMYGDVAIVVIDEEYIDRDGVTKKVMPENTVVLGHTSARGVCLYGAIQDLEAQQEGLDEAERYYKDWIEGKDPAVRYTKAESAPAMYMVDTNRFVVVKVA
ncbi:TPA: major capsid protein [Vibrio campbellii]|jgi:hypothetical protein|nr:major capsid protein [Vibrio campbellii]